ncbi:MAG: hypothetical protein J5953_05295 [Prevotella sp.]|nr:hypothetical protein [Prevotella sp.]
MNKLILAQQKRVIIQTTLVEARCQYNPAIREILTKYISHEGIVTEQNLEATKNWMHRNPEQVIDAACGWYWVNVSRTYLGKAISWHLDERHAIKVKVGRNFNNN